MKGLNKLFGFGLAAGAGYLAGKTVTDYRRDMQEIRARLQAGSQVVDSAAGPVEYATHGDGYPVLSVHGSIGGYDQGLLLGKMAVGSGFRLIAPSRFGFLRTPFPAGPMPVETLPEAQADAFASFLDALHVERAAVMGFSAGAPSALQFAIRHPERVTALVLLSGALWAPPAEQARRQFPLPEAVYEWILNSDLALWAAMKLALPQIEAAFGLSAEMQKSMTPAEREMISDFFHAMLPLSARREGIIRDGPMVNALSRYALEEVVPPTLVVSARDDQVAPCEWGEYTAQHIPGAKFVLYEHGGHTLAGNHAAVNAEVSAFLRRHTQAAQ